MLNSSYLTKFRIVRPAYEKTQEDAISWLAEAHASADRVRDVQKNDRTKESAAELFRKLIVRFGCSPERIGWRGHELEDFNHFDWEKMQIFKISEAPEGLSIGVRQRIYDSLVRAKCDRLFENSDSLGRDLIHVTCTGYLSPSPLQRFVVERGHSSTTRVLHAYHMGCYAALPAIRMADALLAKQFMEPAARGDVGVDVVHTELCTLHFNPMDHSPEQLVVQSLFADGFVKYRVSNSVDKSERAFRILSMNEIQIPGSADAMTWTPVNWGMSMSLSREVPSLIAGALKDYVADLLERAQLCASDVLPSLVYAVHPGGPKIIDHVQNLLEISDQKIQASKAVLKKFGNMSSATLPHVWNEILQDAQTYPAGTKVLSVAFGPGLTIAGGIFEVVG
ncbi:MAG: hypothetical protein RIR26_2524 [Pseudomonadota bacterium]